MPGATGSRESIWTRLPEAWRKLGQTRPLAFAVVGIESTAIQHWAQGGELLGRTADQLTGLRRLALPPDAMIWLQGEADARDATTTATYTAHFETLMHRLQELGMNAPIIVARATRCSEHYSDAVRQAQRALADRHAIVIAGPDLDQLDNTSRRDGCHFSTSGLQRAADLWARSLAASASDFRLD